MSATSSLVTGPVPVWSLLHLVAMASEAMSFGTDSVEFEVTCMIDPVVTDSRSVESVAWFIVTDRILLAGRSLVTDFVPVVPESMRVVESEAGPVGADACTVESETEPVGADACTVESEAGPLVIDPVVSAVKSSLGTDLVESAALLLVTDPDGV